MALIELGYDDALKLLEASHLAIREFSVDECASERLQHAYMEIVSLKAKCEKFLDLALQIQQKFN